MLKTNNPTPANTAEFKSNGSTEVVKTALTETEKVEAQKHEKIVEEGLAGYVAIGGALRTIKDQHLFVGTYEDYVEQRFDITYHTACRKIHAAKVALNLQAAGLTIPAHEDQAYQLRKLNPEKQQEVWREVVEQAKKHAKRITTDLILQVKGETKPQPRTAKADKKGENSPAETTSETVSLPIPSGEKPKESDWHRLSGCGKGHRRFAGRRQCPRRCGERHLRRA